METFPSHVVVVSPHLDDAVLSLAATIARLTRSGRRVDVLTVLAGDPSSRKPAGGWDRRGGFADEGEAMTARRLEDREACRLVGAEPAWLSFPEADYRDGLDGDTVWSAVAEAVADVEAVLLPGFPLTNPDHALVTRLLGERRLPCRRIGLYAEQPYRYMVRGKRPRPQLPDRLRSPGATLARWIHPAGLVPDVRTKRRAILAYRSQVPLLGFAHRRGRKLNRMLLHEALHRGEAIVWLADR